uniref:Uncharacterized protein n=1 Tax=Cacopsylla melanoneura TaxID=428564 RepID=A0A8D8YEQ6_9HEMI
MSHHVSLSPLLILLFTTRGLLFWNLATLKLPPDAILKDIAIHKSRAFLAAPRLNRLQNVTLFEAPWPELSNLTGYASPKLFKPFPSFESQVKHKVLTVDNRHLNSLILDSATDSLFVSDAGDCSLLMLRTADLEYTKLYPRYNEYIVPVLNLAVCNGQLYMTSYDSDMMFSVPLQDLHKVFPYVSEFFREKSSDHVYALNSIYNKYHKYTVKIQNKKMFYSYVFT